MHRLWPTSGATPNRSRTIFQVGHSLVRVESNGEMGPGRLFRSIQRVEDGGGRCDRSKNIFRVRIGPGTFFRLTECRATRSAARIGPRTFFGRAESGCESDKQSI